MKLKGKRAEIGAKPVTLSLFFTANLTQNCLGSKPGLRGRKPATNRLNHGTVLEYQINRCMQKARQLKVYRRSVST